LCPLSSLFQTTVAPALAAQSEVTRAAVIAAAVISQLCRLATEVDSGLDVAANAAVPTLVTRRIALPPSFL
jgi:hypothetical protein